MEGEVQLGHFIYSSVNAEMLPTSLALRYFNWCFGISEREKWKHGSILRTGFFCQPHATNSWHGMISFALRESSARNSSVQCKAASLEWIKNRMSERLQLTLLPLSTDFHHICYSSKLTQGGGWLWDWDDILTTPYRKGRGFYSWPGWFRWSEWATFTLK